ncbi:MAG: hypothetical protein M1813_005740 [Trichoglossum hirsutum]|nr:MAG: hypothetical protein M1813_005740 [Trichoglossum hirsutum]
MFCLTLLVVLVTLSNISVANPLRLNSGSAKFRRIRPAGHSARVNNTQPTTVASSVPPALPSTLVEVSSANALEHPSSDSQKVASVAGDRSVGEDVTFRFPNGSPAATIFLTTASLRSTTRSTAIQSTAPPKTTQSAITVPPTITPSVSSQLSEARPILSSSAAGQPLLGQPLNNQSTSTQPTQSQLNASGAPTLPNSSTTKLPATTPVVPSARSSRSGLANHTTALGITSKVRLTPTIPATAPNPPSTATPQNNLAIARTLNIIFGTLTSDSTCNLNRSAEAMACIGGQLALCGSNGTYSLIQCPLGMQCYALPKTVPGHGAEISCDTTENARLVLGQNATSPSATGPQPDLGNPSTSAENLASSPTVVASSLTLPLPSNSQTLPTSSIPQFLTPTTFSTVTLLTGSLRAPNLSPELPTGGVTTTITQTIPIFSTSPDFHTRRTRPGRPDRPTTAGGVSSIVIPGSILIVTETVTSTATITATATVKG